MSTHVVSRDQRERILPREARGKRVDADVGVECLQPGARRGHLLRSHRARVVQHLSLQVGGVHPVVVDDADAPDPGGGQVERRRRAESSCTDEQHRGLPEALLPCLSDLGQEDVPAVAPQLVVRQLGGHRGCGSRRDLVGAERLV